MLTENLIPQHRPGVGKTRLVRKLRNVAPSARTSRSYRNRGIEIPAQKASEVATTYAEPAHRCDGQPGNFAPPVNSPRAVVIVGDASAHSARNGGATRIDQFIDEVAAVAPSVRDAPAHVGDEFWSGAAQEGSVPTRRVVSGTRPGGWRGLQLVRLLRRLRG